MKIPECVNKWIDRNEAMRQEIAVKATHLTRLIQPYADKMGHSDDLTIFQGEDQIGGTGFCSILLRKEDENKLLCWFLQSNGGFGTGDLQITMADQPASHLSFEKIEVFKLPRKEEIYWLPLKPADQLRNLKLANECLGIIETFRSEAESTDTFLGGYGGGGGMLFQPKEKG